MQKLPQTKLIKKLRSIRTLKQLIYWMLIGLQKPKIKENLKYYLAIDETRQCIGCAATNALLNLLDIDKEDFETSLLQDNPTSFFRNIGTHGLHILTSVDKELDVISRFEYAINSLRSGEIYDAERQLYMMHGLIEERFNVRKALDIPIGAAHLPHLALFTSDQPDARSNKIAEWKQLYNQLK